MLIFTAFAAAGVRSCCNITTTAVMPGEGRAYKWISRDVTSGFPIQRDAANSINEEIFTLQPPYQEYSYKIGLKASTNCNLSTGYSTWRPSSQALQSDLSSYALNSELIICIIARGVNDCGQLVTQTFANSTAYHWIKSAPLGNFSITGPDVLTNDSTPVVSWQPSEFATSYNVVISESEDCTNPLQDHDVLGGTNIELSALNDGNYYACVYSKEDNLGIHPAVENPYAFEVDTTPPGQWELTVPLTNNDPANISVFWNSATDAELYKISVSANSDCGSIINSWDNLNSNFLNISVPYYGTYYLCGEARDVIGNVSTPSNNGQAFTVTFVPSITLLDNIGSDPLTTDKRNSIGNHINSDTSGWYQLPVFNLPVTGSVRLTRYIVHMEGSRPTAQGYLCGPDSSVFTTKLNIWSDIETARMNPKTGNLFNITIVPEALIERSATGGTGMTGCPVEKLVFDLSYANIILSPGTDYYFSFGFVGLAVNDGVWGVLESGFSGQSDWVIYDDFIGNMRKDLVTTFAGSYQGKFAVKVVGVPE